MRLSMISLSSLFLVLSVAYAGRPMNVQVVLRGKKYDVDSVSTVKELQTTVEDQSGISSTKQGRVLFGGRKLKSLDNLEDAGVEDGSVINIVPGKSGGAKKTSASSSATVPSDAGGAGNMMESMLKRAGVDPSQMEELMKSMPGGGEGGMPDMKESMDMMQSMMSSPIFQEYMSDPEKLEQSRQMILSNPMMKGMMAGMPGMDEILNDPVKWRETMLAAADMYKSMGSDLTKLMEGMEDSSINSPTALDELSEGED